MKEVAAYILLWVLMVSCLIFMSFIYLNLFLCMVLSGPGFILLHVAVQFSQHHLLKRLTFFHWVFFPALLKISWLYSCGSILWLWVFYSVPSIYLSVFVPVPYCLHRYVIQFEVWNCDASHFPCVFQHYFGYSWCFLVPYNFRIFYLSSVKNAGIIKCVDCFG